MPPLPFLDDEFSLSVGRLYRGNSHFSAQSHPHSQSYFPSGLVPPLLLEAPKRAVKLYVHSDPKEARYLRIHVLLKRG
jgi:hypothetical protein